MEPSEERTVPAEERCPAVLLVRVRDAPDEHVVRLRDGPPSELADRCAFAGAERAFEEHHRALAGDGVVVVSLESCEVVLANDEQGGGGIGHGNIPKRRGIQPDAQGGPGGTPL